MTERGKQIAPEQDYEMIERRVVFVPIYYLMMQMNNSPRKDDNHIIKNIRSNLATGDRILVSKYGRIHEIAHH